MWNILRDRKSQGEKWRMSWCLLNSDIKYSQGFYEIGSPVAQTCEEFHKYLLTNERTIVHGWTKGMNTVRRECLKYNHWWSERYDSTSKLGHKWYNGELSLFFIKQNCIRMFKGLSNYATIDEKQKILFLFFPFIPVVSNVPLKHCLPRKRPLQLLT